MYMYTRPSSTNPNPSAPNLWEMSGLCSPGSLPSTSIVFEGGPGGAAPTTETSSSTKSMRCVAGSADGLLVHGVSKNSRAVPTFWSAGIVNRPSNVAHWPLVAVTLTRFVYVPPP